MTYLHLIADNYEKFCDSRALPVVYMLCYVGIDVSAQDKEESETALHRLMRKPGAYKIVVALLRWAPLHLSWMLRIRLVSRVNFCQHISIISVFYSRNPSSSI